MSDDPIRAALAELVEAHDSEDALIAEYNARIPKTGSFTFQFPDPVLSAASQRVFTAMRDARIALAAKAGPKSYESYCEGYRDGKDFAWANPRAATVMPAAPSDLERGRVVLFDRGFRQDEDWFVTAAPHEDGGEYLHIDTLTALVAALRPTAPKPAENEQALRELLAVHYAGAALYADDGELQDNRRLPFIDFARDTPTEIYHKFVQRNSTAPSPTSSAPAEPDQPVAWRYKDSRGHWRYTGNVPDAYHVPILKPEPLYARPALASSVPPEQQREHKGLS